MWTSLTLEVVRIIIIFGWIEKEIIHFSPLRNGKVKKKRNSQWKVGTVATVALSCLRLIASNALALHETTQSAVLTTRMLWDNLPRASEREWVLFCLSFLFDSVVMEESSLHLRTLQVDCENWTNTPICKMFRFSVNWPLPLVPLPLPSFLLCTVWAWNPLLDESTPVRSLSPHITTCIWMTGHFLTWRGVFIPHGKWSSSGKS